MVVASQRKRIAIVGGGVAGLVTAWLLESAHDVVLFERNSYLGGHAHSIEGGFDLGAQFVSPLVQPTYWTLAHDILGIKMHRIASTVALRNSGLLLDSTRPHRTPLGAATLAALLLAGRLDCPWEMTVEEFFSRRLQWLPASALRDVALPWIAAWGNCVIPTALEWSAKAALAFMIRGSRFLAISYYNADEGLGAIAEHLRPGDTRCSTEVSQLTRSPDGFHIGAEIFDEVVLAVPAGVARKLLTGVLERDLSGFREIEATVSIHTDPVYMPPDRRDWRALNAVRNGDYCEASMWYGGLRRTDERVFKSWTTFRTRQPSEVIARETFVHPVITPDTIRNQQRLATVQGRDGLWFAGSWTTDVDSQESAVVSALRISEKLGGRRIEVGKSPQSAGPIDNPLMVPMPALNQWFGDVGANALATTRRLGNGRHRIKQPSDRLQKSVRE